MIDAKIVKVSLNNDLDAGIDWDNIFTNLDFHGIDRVGDFRRVTDKTNAATGAEIPAVTPISIGSKFGFNKNGPMGKQLGDLVKSRDVACLGNDSRPEFTSNW